jgi:hypothetical protein
MMPFATPLQGFVSTAGSIVTGQLLLAGDETDGDDELLLAGDMTDGDDKLTIQETI